MTPELVHHYHEIFNTPSCQAVLQDLKARSQFGESVFTRGLEPWQPAYRDGNQSTVRHILAMLATPLNTSTKPTIKK